MSAVALYHRTSLRVIDLFKFGLDTVEIADRLGISEAQALKELTLQRSQKLMASNPYSASGDARLAERKAQQFPRSKRRFRPGKRKQDRDIREDSVSLLFPKLNTGLSKSGAPIICKRPAGVLADTAWPMT